MLDLGHRVASLVGEYVRREVAPSDCLAYEELGLFCPLICTDGGYPS